MGTGPACKVDKHFANLTDPRVNRGTNHDLHEMIFMALTATICGANSWADVERFVNAKCDWFARFLALEQGVPSHDTFGRVFARLDTGEFLTAMHGWVDEFCGSLRGQGVAIDGKAHRGSFDTAAGQPALHTITAFATETRLCLRQMAVDDKSNEIPAVPVLLQLLELEGATVTLDAMHCQVETAQAILSRKADYLLSVKDNQPTLHQHLQDRFEACAEAGFKGKGLTRLVTKARSHGRDERRQYYVLEATSADKQVLKRWPGLQSLIMVFRQRTEADQESLEVAYYISSHAPKVRALAAHIRSHWGIENSLHHVLDVTFTEDASRIRRGHAPEISASLRRMALNILQRDTTVKDNIRGKRLRAGWDEDVLEQIWTAFSAV
ncbi:MAG: ISAs1 family transposase [Deltaproteobacteria bacterium]|nr:ISAs1 family transposase [Deltaproteobacteria bacterium]